jgi:UDP-N-acetylglucosamine 1-carboxyvinyltransferase
MGYLEIEGGRPLNGSVRIQGSKNAALPILSAALLNPGVTVLHNCPRITDVTCMLAILEKFGCSIRRESDSLIIDASCVSETRVPEEYARKMRSSIMLLGSLLGRTGEAFVPYPGGCVIGARPVDLHIEALRSMGVELREEEQGLNAVCNHVKGGTVRLPFPSVGATENILLLAVCAEGTICLENAAREPEIVELCRFLCSMGARIHGAGTSCITVCGVSRLHDTEFTIMPDRIVAGTYMLLVGACGGEAVLEQVPRCQLTEVERVLERLGIRCKGDERELHVERYGRIHSLPHISTEPYPGFPTDLQSPLMAVLACGEGESIIRENIFEARFKIAQELVKMGAHIRTEGNEACICGVEKLHGAELTVRELRGGAALALAAAAAEGASRIFEYHYIERGYENIIGDLQDLGVVIHLKEEH